MNKKSTNMRLEGIYAFYRGKQWVADLLWKKGEVAAIKKADSSLLPPVFNRQGVASGFPEADGRLGGLQQFFASRRLPLSHPYYHLLSVMEGCRYWSLFDDYHISFREGEADVPPAYSLEDDPYVFRVLQGARLKGGSSPNLSLPYPNLSLFETEGTTRYLLREYSHALADRKKELGVPYTIRVFRDIPFIRVALPEGRLYPLVSLLPPGTIPAQADELLQERGLTLPSSGMQDCYLLEEEEQGKVSIFLM